MAAAQPDSVIVVGGGPAGLTAAYELCRAGVHAVVLEKNDKVGGLARTESYRGFHFDIGGHRFFTKVDAVSRMWREVLGDDFLRRPRLSRIYYRGRFFPYPLKPWNSLTGLGPWQSVLVALSYFRWQVAPYDREDTFEEWVTNRFGRRLFMIFFKSYTEKVWGIPCTELQAEWAAQRIKDLSLKTAIVTMFFSQRNVIKTLIEEFDYPRLGPGMMWNAVRDRIAEAGGVVELESDVTRIRRDGSRIVEVVVEGSNGGTARTANHFISTMPITELIARIDPPPPDEVVEAARTLRHRDFLTVCVIIDKPDLFPDNWIYVHDPNVRVARIQNFKNWSSAMVPDGAKSSLGLEYFCNQGDDIWCLPDDELVKLAASEVAALGLARPEDVEDGCVVRIPHAYPVYDARYRAALETVRNFVDGLANLQTIGRSGLHHYDNQDHAMLTGMLAARNLTAGERNDVWAVNVDQEYQEEIREEIRQELGVSPEEADEVLHGALAPAFAKLDRTAFGMAVGVVMGMALCLATLFLVFKGGDVVGPNLSLLGQFFPSYRVTVSGSFVGLAYGLMVGFLCGWTFAVLRNASALAVATLIRRRVELQALGRILDYV